MLPLEATPKTYKLVSEGQTIPLPTDIGESDDKLRRSLGGLVAGIAEAKLIRTLEKETNVETITLAVKALSKGLTSRDMLTHQQLQEMYDYGWEIIEPCCWMLDEHPERGVVWTLGPADAWSLHCAIVALDKEKMIKETYFRHWKKTCAKKKSISKIMSLIFWKRPVYDYFF